MPAEQVKRFASCLLDWEAQFSCTIAHCERCAKMYRGVIEQFFWVALPLTTQNSLTQFTPGWQCCKEPARSVAPAAGGCHHRSRLFPVLSAGMSFETFVRRFADWFSQNRPAAVMVGIRADESLNRFITISSQPPSCACRRQTTGPRRPGGRPVYLSHP